MVAHDLKNLLAVVLGHAELQRARAEEMRVAHEREVARATGARVRRLLHADLLVHGPAMHGASASMDPVQPQRFARACTRRR